MHVLKLQQPINMHLQVQCIYLREQLLLELQDFLDCELVLPNFLNHIFYLQVLDTLGFLCINLLFLKKEVLNIYLSLIHI